MSHIDPDVRLHGKSSGKQQQRGGGKMAGERKTTSANSKPMDGQLIAKSAREENPHGPPRLGSTRAKKFNSHLSQIGWNHADVAKKTNITQQDVAQVMHPNAQIAGQKAQHLHKIGSCIGLKLSGTDPKQWGTLYENGKKLLEQGKAEKAAEKAEKQAEEKAAKETAKKAEEDAEGNA